MIAACPLAFGEVGVKDRVKSVLNYKKPAFWIVAVAIIPENTETYTFDVRNGKKAISPTEQHLKSRNVIFKQDVLQFN